jgi:hypothetical protein
MWVVPALVDATVALPVNTPIPCLICKAETASTLTFSGTVQLAQSNRLDIFNGKTHQTMRFAVPPEFRGVDSSDGQIKGATVARAVPGLLARVTYRTAGEARTVTGVLLLTIEQCRALMAAEHISQTASVCPD